MFRMIVLSQNIVHRPFMRLSPFIKIANRSIVLSRAPPKTRRPEFDRSKMVGRYRLAETHNLEQFLAEMGEGLLMRKIAPYLVNIVQMVVEEDQGWWILKTGRTEQRFRMGETFEQVIGDDNHANDNTNDTNDIDW